MFKKLENFEKYEINSEGIIRNRKTQKVKYTRINKQGYLTVQFKIKGKIHSYLVHRLVGEIFLEEPEEYLIEWAKNNYPFTVCINHKDGNKLNNSVENLEWCTHEYNTKHAWDNNLTPALKGSLNGRAKLNEETVHEMCKLFELGFMPKYVSELLGVSYKSAGKIRSGYAWNHISSQYNIKVNKRK